MKRNPLCSLFRRHINERLLMIIVCLIPLSVSFAQTIERYIISPYGNAYDNNFQIIQATVGEPAVLMRTDSFTFFLTEGFQQPTPSERVPEDYLIKLDIYPNPVSEQIHVRFFVKDIDDFTIKVYDITGNLVYSCVVEGVFSGQVKTINLAGLPQGLYLVNVYSYRNQMKQVKKITKI